MNGLNGTGLGVAALMKTAPAPAQPAAPKAPPASPSFQESTTHSVRPRPSRPSEDTRRVSNPEHRVESSKPEKSETDKDVTVDATSQKSDPQGDSTARDGAKTDAKIKDTKTQDVSSNEAVESRDAAEATIEELLSLIQQSQDEIAKPADPAATAVVAAISGQTNVNQEILTSDSSTELSSTPQEGTTVAGNVDAKPLVDAVTTQVESAAPVVASAAGQVAATADTAATEASEIVARASEGATPAQANVSAKRNSGSASDDTRASKVADVVVGAVDAPIEQDERDDDKVVVDNRTKNLNDPADVSLRASAAHDSRHAVSDTRHHMSHAPQSNPDVSLALTPVSATTTATATPVLEPLTDGMTNDQTLSSVAPPPAPQAPARPANNVPPPATTAVNINLPVMHPSWGDAMSERVQWMVGNQMQTANIQVNPPHLGPVNVQIEMKGDEVNVVFSTHQGAVREALESSLPKLREILNDSGSRTVNIDVSLQDFQQRQSSQFFGQEAERHARNREHFPQQSDYDIQTVSVAPASRQGRGMLDIYA